VRNGVSEMRKFTAPEPAPIANAEAAPAPRARAVETLEKAPPAPEAAAPRPVPMEALAKAALAVSAAADKLERAIDENSRMRQAVTDFQPRVENFERRLAALEAQPAPARAALRSAPREADYGYDSTRPDNVETAIKQLSALPDEQRALALTKISLANPMVRRF